MDKKQIKQRLSGNDDRFTTFDVIHDYEMPEVGDEEGCLVLEEIEEVKPYFKPCSEWSEDMLNSYLYRYYKLMYSDKNAKRTYYDHIKYVAIERSHSERKFTLNNIDEVMEFCPYKDAIYIDGEGLGFTGKELDEHMHNSSISPEYYVGEWTEISIL